MAVTFIKKSGMKRRDFRIVSPTKRPFLAAGLAPWACGAASADSGDSLRSDAERPLKPKPSSSAPRPVRWLAGYPSWRRARDRGVGSGGQREQGLRLLRQDRRGLPVAWHVPGPERWMN